MSDTVVRLPLPPRSKHIPLAVGMRWYGYRIDSEPFLIGGRGYTIYYECVCDCGTRRPVASDRLLKRSSNPARSCGCGAGGPLPEQVCRVCGGVARHHRLCQKCYRKRHPEHQRRWMARQRESVPAFLRWRLNRTRNRTRPRRKVTITLARLCELWEQQGGKCSLSELPMSTRKHCPYAATIDRIDSAYDYVDGNVQLVCYCMNLAKGNWSDAGFRLFLDELAAARRVPAMSLKDMDIGE